MACDQSARTLSANSACFFENGSFRCVCGIYFFKNARKDSRAELNYICKKCVQTVRRSIMLLYAHVRLPARMFVCSASTSPGEKRGEFAPEMCRYCTPHQQARTHTHTHAKQRPPKQTRTRMSSSRLLKPYAACRSMSAFLFRRHTYRYLPVGIFFFIAAPWINPIHDVFK